MDILTLTPEGRELSVLLPPPGRHLLGICGAPGAGKSRLAAYLARTYGAVVVPMDGFHLADVELARRGLLDRKGAPDSFDGWGYAALLGRLHARPDHVVMAPSFERRLEQPIAGSIPVSPDAGLVVTEGNYLLLDDAPWRAVRERLDAVWHVPPRTGCGSRGWSRGTCRSARPRRRRGPGSSGSTSPTRASSRPRASGPTCCST